ncbi:MAG TPA: hypothetical protein VFA83_22150, partial [Acidimicrobiales bacterium]|nr:hypothetical protein [Acidimicrobiales bacterium]
VGAGRAERTFGAPVVAGAGVAPAVAGATARPRVVGWPGWTFGVDVGPAPVEDVVSGGTTPRRGVAITMARGVPGGASAAPGVALTLGPAVTECGPWTLSSEATAYPT